MGNVNSAEMKNEAGKAYGDLIREYRMKAGMSQLQLGLLAGVKKNAVGAWEAGRSRPDVASVPVLCRALGLPISEFFGITGEGIANEKSGRAEIPELEKRYRRLDDNNRKVILCEMDALYEMQKKEAEYPPRKKLVRLFRNDLSAAAGYSYDIGESTGEMVWLVADPLIEMADEIIHVSGDSMEPTFYDGDQVLVQHMSRVKIGEIGIFVNGNTGYIKEYRKEGLFSHNPAYPIMKFSDDDDVRCIGRVLGVLRRDQYATENEIAAWLK